MDQAGTPRDNDVSPGAAQAPAGPGSSLTVTDGKPGSAPAQAQDARAGQPGSRVARWLGAAFARQLAILAGFVAAGIALTWPRASYLWDHELPGTRDASSFVWGFWWVAHQVEHLSNPWFTRSIAAPVGTQLGFHTLLPLPGLVMTPVTLAFGPSASYNLLSALTPGLLAYAMYRVGRLWVRSQVGAIAAGAFFGLSSMLDNQSWYELNLALGAVFIPLGLEAAVRLRRRPGWPRAVILGVILGAALLTDQETALLALTASALALLPWVVRDGGARAAGPAGEQASGQARGRAVRSLVARLGTVTLAAVVALVVASPQMIAMGQQAAAGGATVPPHVLAWSYTLYGAGLLGLVSPSPRIASYGLQGPASFFYQHGIVNPAHQFSSGLVASYVPMFGVTLTVLAVIGLIVCYRRRNAWYLALLAVGCAILALGPVLWIGAREFVPFAVQLNGVRLSMLMPYTWLVRLPGLSSFREAARLAELGLAGAALLAASAIDWMRHNAKPALVVAAVLSVAELGWAGNPPGNVMPSALRIPTMGTSYPRLDSPIAADHSSSIVVDFPFGIRGGEPLYGAAFAPQSEVLATADGHPLADAVISHVPASTINGIKSHPFYADLLVPWNKPRTVLSAAQYRAAALDAQRMNVGWVIVWPTHVPRAINRYLTHVGFTLAYQVHQIKVYRR